MQVSISKVGVEACEALAAVGAATFLETFAGEIDGRDIVSHGLTQHTAQAYRDLLTHKAGAAWLATVEPGAAPVGYALLCRPDLPMEGLGEADWEIKRIYALSRFHGQGVGRHLMEGCVAEARARQARRVLLGTGKFNRRAIAFYQRAGFQIVAERLFQVGANRYDDWILALDLTAAG
jgi:diamine N-acetyltransferase